MKKKRWLWRKTGGVGIMSNQMNCPKCDSEKIEMEKRPGGWFQCQDCHHAWQPYPIRFGFDALPNKQTVFETITQSEETLAEKLVVPTEIRSWGGKVRRYWAWSTVITEGWWERRAEAVAAAVARLKEVGDGN